MATTAAQVQTAYKAIARAELNAATAQAVADAINGGTLSLAQYEANTVASVVNTTQAAVALSAFVTGTVPDSAKVDGLTAFATAQYNYYANTLKSGSAQLGAYEALGKAYATDATTAPTLQARYGALSAADFVNTAYLQVFNKAPTAAQAANLVAQVNYFTALYTSAGVAAADAALQAKGAVLGQIIGYAVTTSDATASIDDGVTAALTTLANEAVAGTTPSTVYGKALGSGAGAALVAVVDGNISLDGATATTKATIFADTVSGTISGVTKDVSINTGAGDDSIGTATAAVTLTEGAKKIAIDGSGGTDSLYATLTTGITDGNTTIANVEKIFVGSAAAQTIDTSVITGAQEIWSYKTGAAGDLTFDKIGAGITLGVSNNAVGGDTTFNLASKGAANLSLDTAAASIITLTNATSLAVNVVSNSTSSLVSTDSKTLTITGNGNLVAANVDLNAAYTSIDASASKGSVALSSVDASTAAVTIKLTEKADLLDLTLAATSKAVTITTGAGADAISISGGGNVGDIDTTKSVFTTITDFTTKSDTLNVKLAVGGAEYAFNAADKTAVSGLSLAAALEYGAGKALAKGGFELTFGGDSYVFADTDGDAHFSAGDTLIKLVGVTSLDAADVTFS